MTEIPISRIDLKDRRFSLSYGRDNERLRSSIAQAGIIEPVILLNRTPYIIIAGHRRIACARDLHIRSIPALITDLIESEALLRAIHANLERGYSIIEKALILEKMKGLHFKEADIFSVMKYIDLSPHEKILRSFLTLAKADGPSRQFIVRNSLSLKNIESFLRFGPGERKKIMAALANFRLTESTLREILDMIHLLLVRKEKLSSRDIPKMPDADSLKTHLKKRTHPILASLTKKMKAIRDKISLPPGMDIRVDPFFEKEYIDVVLRITREEDLNTAFERILKLVEAGHIRSILELTKGGIR